MFGQNTGNTGSNSSKTSISLQQCREANPEMDVYNERGCDGTSGRRGWRRLFPRLGRECYRSGCLNGDPEMVASAIRADRVAAGDRCEDRLIGLEGPAGYLEPLPRNHRLIGCG